MVWMREVVLREVKGVRVVVDETVVVDGIGVEDGVGVVLVERKSLQEGERVAKRGARRHLIFKKLPDT